MFDILFRHFSPRGPQPDATGDTVRSIDVDQERRWLADALDACFTLLLPNGLGVPTHLCVAVDTRTHPAFEDLARLHRSEGALDYLFTWYLLPEASTPCMLLRLEFRRPVRDTFDVKFDLPTFERTLALLPAYGTLHLAGADRLEVTLGRKGVVGFGVGTDPSLPRLLALWRDCARK